MPRIKTISLILILAGCGKATQESILKHDTRPPPQTKLTPLDLEDGIYTATNNPEFMLFRNAERLRDRTGFTHNKTWRTKDRYIGVISRLRGIKKVKRFFFLQKGKNLDFCIKGKLWYDDFNFKRSNQAPLETIWKESRYSDFIHLSAYIYNNYKDDMVGFAPLGFRMEYPLNAFHTKFSRNSSDKAFIYQDSNNRYEVKQKFTMINQSSFLREDLILGSKKLYVRASVLKDFNQKTKIRFCEPQAKPRRRRVPPSPPKPAPPPPPPKIADPLVLDFSGEGNTYGDASTAVRFDMDGDGKRRERLHWITKPTSAFLAFDRNQNGRIESVDELFGKSIGGDGSRGDNGFISLASWDGNEDGWIDAEDGIYDHLLLWFDTNKDGRSAHDELFSLRDKKVREIRLNYKSLNETDAKKNVVTARSYFVLSDGKKHIVDNVVLFDTNQ